MSKRLVTKAINFTATPAVGTVFMRAGQRYELIRQAPYQRRDGRLSVLLTWRSHCAECGELFHITTGLATQAVNRRCPKHHQPRVPVDGRLCQRRARRMARRRDRDKRHS